MAKKQKIAILGGGMAGIVAAYELTDTPALRERYDVTVYQFGWRLGGKCASGRNPRHHQRIEEHGLHVWFGFYENAFRVMRDAYTELGRDPSEPLATWRDAFKPCDDIVLYEEWDGRWRGWSFAVPRNLLTPGDATALPQFWEVAHTMLAYLLARWGSLATTRSQVSPGVSAASGLRLPSLPFGMALPFGLSRVAANAWSWLLRQWASAPELVLREALARADRWRGEELGSPAEVAEREFLLDAIDAFKEWLWRFVVSPNLDDDELRLFFTQFDVGATILEGIIEDGLIEGGFDVVNNEDLRKWLRRHGAREITVDQSPFVRSLYDMAFAYKDGDINQPDMAAGTAVHDMLRLFFTYRGAFTWKMQAGMGDTVFTPFYEVLRRRGVRFEYFSWITRLGLSADKRSVDSIEFIPQAFLKAREHRPPGLEGHNLSKWLWETEYKPLVSVDGLGCWPSVPDFDQLLDGDELEDREVNLEWEPNPLGHLPVTLRKEEDFDQVVLAISVAGLPDICAELIADEANPRFGAMIKNSHTCMTQAFQLWMNRPVPALAWPFRENSIMTAYVEPLDTYANMSYLRAREAWPPEARVESIAYFCGVIEDRHDDTQQTTNGRAKANAIAYLQGGARGIWPNCHMKAGGFDWGLLVGADANAGDAPGPQSFDSQYWLANFQRTERYVLTPAGSVKYRLAADESGYENLYLAGDWTKTGLDAGCVEAATMSGMQAARVICGSPRYIIGEDQKWLSGMSSTRPPEAALQYVEYGGLATVPSPVDCEGATLYSFFLEADHTVLDDLCRRVFTQPSGGQIDMRPLGRHVMLSFGVIDKVRPQREPWSLMGYASERQAAFWIPVVTVRNEGGRMVAVSLGWFIPYMWVDNPLSLAGGREIYGYNKNWGWIKLPSDDGDIGLTLDAYGGNYTGDEPAGRHPLIEVAPVSSGSFQRSGERWDDLDTVLAEVQRALGTGDSEFVDLPGLELPDQIYEAILGRSGPPQIFLKQFRSVSDGERASQQQITDAGSTVKRLVGWPLLGKYDFKLHELDSHPVAKELGVHSHQVTPLAFEFDVDFVLNEGQVVWQAPAD